MAMSIFNKIQHKSQFESLQFFCHFCIESEEVSYDFWFRCVGRETIGRKNCLVISRVGGAEVGWHREWIVEVSERGIGITGTNIEYHPCSN